MRYAVELVGEVKKDCCAGWEVTCRFWGGDVFLNLELHGFEDKVVAVGGADCPTSEIDSKVILMGHEIMKLL